MLATVSALMLLLLAPGPTNTLLFRAGVLFGYRASWTLVFIECLAYLLQVSVWGVALLYLAAYSPGMLNITQLGAACYLLYVSFRLWQRKSSAVTAAGDGFSGLYFLAHRDEPQRPADRFVYRTGRRLYVAARLCGVHGHPCDGGDTGRGGVDRAGQPL